MTRIVIEVQGGMVSAILADTDYQAIVVDLDLEGSGEEEDAIMRVAPSDAAEGDYQLAYVSDWAHSQQADKVNEYYARVEAADQQRRAS